MDREREREREIYIVGFSSKFTIGLLRRTLSSFVEIEAVNSAASILLRHPPGTNAALLDTESRR